MLTRVARASEVWEGEMVPVKAGDLKLVLIHTGDGIHAYEDRCCHQAVPLSEGKLEGRVLECAAHHWSFDVTTGCGLNPKSARLRKFRVEVRGDDVLVDIGEVP